MFVLKIPKISILILVTVALFASVASVAAQGEGSTEAAALSLHDQTSLALTHATSANEASTLTDLKRHAEQVVNIVDGSGGVLAYAATAIGNAQNAADAFPDDTDVQSEAVNVIAAVGNVNNWASLARDQASQGIAATDLTVARFATANMVDRLTDAINGSDEDGDGTVEPIDGEGGTATAYLHSQNLEAAVVAAGGLPEPTLPATGDLNLHVVALWALLAGVVLCAMGGGIVVRSGQNRLID